MRALFAAIVVLTLPIAVHAAEPGSGAGFDGLYNFFAKGNPWSLGKLAERFETGPIDWKKALEKPAH